MDIRPLDSVTATVIAPAPSRIATASAALRSRLVIACRIIRRSHGATGPRGGMPLVQAIPGSAVFCRISVSRTISPTSSGLITGRGMRAKAENSSTMRPMSPTWRMMVSAHWLNVSGSEVISLVKRRFSRSAASWIGVSGFLISCAMRRATSAQAALRWASWSSVMSSKVTMKPLTRPAVVSAPMRASRVRGLLAGPMRISSVSGRSGVARAAWTRAANSGATASRSRPMAASRSTPRSSAAARLGSSIRPRASRPITPAETPASTVSVKRRRPSIWLYASISSERWAASWPVMRLKARDRPASSSRVCPSVTRTPRSPPRTRSAALISVPMGRAI